VAQDDQVNQEAREEDIQMGIQPDRMQRAPKWSTTKTRLPKWIAWSSVAMESTQNLSSAMLTVVKSRLSK
jgi:hypothetical protein